MNRIDRFIVRIDRAVRTLAGRHVAARPSPARHAEAELADDEERDRVGALMRVNHCGEVCAQALYEGQALTARKAELRAALLAAAREEEDHLAWCGERLTELHGSPSVLNPFFYGASYTLGAVTGALGDRISLGFLAATEEQVVTHLEDHLERLPMADGRSRAVLMAMRDDEERHGTRALESGGVRFPAPVKSLMSLASKVMTGTTYRI